MIREIERLRDARQALGRGGYIVTVRRCGKGSSIHGTGCPAAKMLRKIFGKGSRSGREAGARYYHGKSLKEALLFWSFERVEPDIVPCEECRPCGKEAPDIQDCDRELYDWMGSEEKTIVNMRALMYKFIDAYAAGGQSREAFEHQVRITRKIARSGAVRAVEVSDGRGKDVDAQLRDGSNIQIWHGRYEPDYESERAGRGGARRYERRRIEVGSIGRKLGQLPDGEKGFVVNPVPGDTLCEPPGTLLTEDKCVISSEDGRHVAIYRALHFKHIEDARRICAYLDWDVAYETEGMASDVWVGFKEVVMLSDTWSVKVV